eukprot:gene43597-36735_t
MTLQQQGGGSGVDNAVALQGEIMSVTAHSPIAGDHSAHLASTWGWLRLTGWCALADGCGPAVTGRGLGREDRTLRRVP